MNTNPTGISSAFAEAASDSKPSETLKPVVCVAVGCVASFPTIVQTGAKYAFSRFKQGLLGQSYLFQFNGVGHLAQTVGFVVFVWLFDLFTWIYNRITKKLLLGNVYNLLIIITSIA